MSIKPPKSDEGRKGEHGQVAVIVALMMTAMMGMLGLIVDGGILLSERRALQNAADAAALAAAYDLQEGRGQSVAVASALYYAGKNGYNNDGNANRVTISIPPTSGPHAGDGNFGQVVITSTLGTFFIQVVYSGVSTAAASATAGVTLAPAPYALIALDRSVCNALDVRGNGELEVEGGGIMVNSSCASNAFNINGNAGVTVENGQFDINGGYRVIGNAHVSPTPRTGRPPIEDPLAMVPAPSFDGLVVRNGDPHNPSTFTIGSNRVETIYPGIYYGGIKVNGNARVTLQPGTYILAGGGLTVEGNADLTGDNVFIYNTQDPTNPGMPGDPGHYTSIKLTGNGDIHLSPPNSGQYKGLLFFQDRNNTEPFRVIGNADFDRDVKGTVYFPSAACLLSGNGHEDVASQMICNTVGVSGNGELEIEYNGPYLYQLPYARLVE